MLVYRYYVYGQKNAKGGAIMSILLELPHRKTVLLTKSKPEPKTSSILLISVVIIIVLSLATFVGLVYTDDAISGISGCRDKIIGFEQKGMYGSPEQFKLALSYCGLK